jgi:GntR family transcriptional regulator
MYRKVIRSLRKVISFTENMEKQNISPSAKVLENNVLGGYTIYHQKLNARESEKILRIKRLKYGDNVPLLIDTRYIKLKFSPDIINSDPTGSLYKIYEKYNIKIVRTSQFLELTFLDEKNAKLLDYKKGDPVIYIEGLLYTDNDNPIAYEEDLWNGRVFRFYLEANT